MTTAAKCMSWPKVRLNPYPRQPYYLCIRFVFNIFIRNWRLLKMVAPAAANAMVDHGIKHLFVFCRPDLLWRVNDTFSKVRQLLPVFKNEHEGGHSLHTRACMDGNIHIKPTFPTQTQFGDARVSPTFFDNKGPAFHRLVHTLLGDKADRLGVLPLYAEQAVAVLAEVFIGTEVRTLPATYLP